MIAILLNLLAGYFAFGTLFALWFCAAGAGRLDPHARQGSRGFRVLIFPGTTVLWPLLLTRILRGVRTPPIERTAHRLAARQPSSTP